MKKVTVTFNVDSLSNLTLVVADQVADSIRKLFYENEYAVIRIDGGDTGIHYLNSKNIAGISIVGVANDN